MEIGVFSSCVAGKSVTEQMGELARLGYDFLEMSFKAETIDALPGGVADELRDASGTSGVPVRSAVLGSFPEFAAVCASEEARNAAMKRLESVCEFLSEWGPGAVLLLPLWEPSGGVEVEGAYLENLPEVADRAAELAVKVALEHIGASKYRPKASEVIDLVRRVRHPNLGAYVDIGNAESSGEEPLGVLEDAGDYLFQIHLKGSRNVPFEAMPLDEMSVLLGEIAYDGRAAVEIPARGGNSHLQSALALIRGAGLA